MAGIGIDDDTRLHAPDEAVEAGHDGPNAPHESAFRLRPTLVATIVGLVIITALTIGASAALLTLSNTRALIDRSRDSLVAATRTEIQRFFDVAPAITRELAAEARRGALRLDRPEEIATLFAERLRRAPQLAWIGYGDRVTGRYIGAVRYGDNEIVQYTADPAVNGAMPHQVAVAADGTRSKPTVIETKPYFVTSKDWFKQGIAAHGPVWSGFYHFTGGGIGVTCMSRFTAPGAGAPTGLFHADLRVSEIADFLSQLKVGERGAVFLVDRDGKRLVSPRGATAAAAAAALDKVEARRLHRPGLALSGLAAPLRIGSHGRSYEVTFTPAGIKGDIGLGIAVVVDLADITESIYREATIALLTGLAAVAVSIGLGLILSTRIARPVAAIAADLATVGEFKISQLPAPRSFVREISELGGAVDRMKASLRSFGHYVPTGLVRTLLAAGREAELGGEIRRLSIHFSDVTDFTAISEGMTPTALVAATGRYFALMTAALSRHGGTVDKFMGDGILAFFNAPTDLPDHPAAACVAALEAQDGLARMAAAVLPGEPIFRARIGLGYGDVLVGNIGTPDRFSYTVIGDEVNLASRLEGLNKVYGTAILATDALAAETGDRFDWRLIDRVAVKGRHQGTLVRELLGLRGAVATAIIEARDVYVRALELYFRGDFVAAHSLFEAAARLRPEDRAARTMAARCRDFAAAPPADWNGIHVMHEK